MNLSDFDYSLPAERIAQEPLADRAGARMLVVDRATGRWEDRMFREFPSLLREGDAVVVNDSKVFPARLYGHRLGFEGHVEVFLVRPLEGGNWLCLVRPGRKVRSGDRIVFGDLECEVIGRNEHGERIVRFHCEGDLYEALERVGHVPLPPYIHRADRPEDRERYQTVFARERGSVAAPTAGLHFTPEILARIPNLKRVTLHVGLGTFQPLRGEKLHSEWYRVPETITGKRIVAVGTTTVRTLETTGGQAGEGETSLFIQPGYQFKVVGAMLTNFHLPQSSLLVLVCAFGGRELILDAYAHAVREGYRFYSYGDCMFVV